MTDRERLIALFAACLVQHVRRVQRPNDARPLPISPTMRPDPQAVAASHGALISHESA
jgi:hypothetical protein